MRLDAWALRHAQQAATRAAWLRLQAVRADAAARLQQSHAQYLASFTLARQQQDQVLPLRQQMLDEQQKRYNGMLISVFDLLAEAREQALAVRNAIRLQQQFWLDEAELQHALQLGGLPLTADAVPHTPPDTTPGTSKQTGAQP